MKKPHAVRLFFGFLSRPPIALTTGIRTAQTPHTAFSSDATRNPSLYAKNQ